MTIVKEKTNKYIKYAYEIFKMFADNNLNFNDGLNVLVLAIVLAIDDRVEEEEKLQAAKNTAEALIKNFEKERHN